MRAAFPLGAVVFIGCSFDGGQRAAALPSIDGGDHDVAATSTRMPVAGAAAVTAEVMTDESAASAIEGMSGGSARRPLSAAPRIVLRDSGVRERLPAPANAASVLTGTPAHPLDAQQPGPTGLGGIAAQSAPGTWLPATSPAPSATATGAPSAPEAIASPSGAIATPSDTVGRQWWPSIASAWHGWRWVVAIALLLLLLLAWRHRSKAGRERRAAAARPRAITWQQVKAPDAQLAQDHAGFVYDDRPLPSVAVEIHLTPPGPPSPSPSPASTRLSHDPARSADARLRAIGAVVDAPLVLNRALPPCVSRVSYERIDAPAQPAVASPAPVGTVAHDVDAVITLIETEAVNEDARLAGDAATPIPEPVTAEVPRTTAAIRVAVEPDAIASAQQPAGPAVISAPAPTASLELSERVGQAKHCLTADRPEQALAALAPLLDGDRANGEAWTVAGWSWWRIGRDRPGRQLEAARNAAAAFTSALRVEPERANLLSRMIARCHLMQAAHQGGAERLASLDEAIAVYDRYLQGHTRDDAVLLEWAEALYERAAATPRGERPRWLDRSERVVEQRWGTTLSDAGEPVRWLWINLLLSRAELVDARTAGALNARAVSLLQAGLPHLDEGQREAWLTRLIEAERANAQRLSGAARISRLQATQSSVEGWLGAARSVHPLLAWIGLLGDWAASLHGTAAQSKLSEAEAFFARIEAISPDDSAQTRFARAYYLRLRARREFGITRWHTLDQARALLVGIAPGELPQALIDLETAQIHLEQARLTEGVPQQSHFASAAHLAESAALAPENESRALLCALMAMVAITQAPAHESAGRHAHSLPRMKALAQRLHELVPNDAEALQVVASVHLASDEPQRACELCAAAWEAGAARAGLMPIWREADARWARTLDPAQQGPHWKRLHQGMRMASSTP